MRPEKEYQNKRVKPYSITRLGVLAAYFFLCSTVPAQKITSDFSHNFDFSANKRYAWGKNYILTRQGREKDELIDQRIIQYVDRLLTGKGFIKDDTRPNFFISYEAGAPSSFADFEGPYSGPSPHLTDSPVPVYGIPQNVWYSVDSQIVFNLVDAKSKQAIWSVSAKKKIRDPQKRMNDMERQVEKIVSKMFESFPPRAR